MKRKNLSLEIGFMGTLLASWQLFGAQIHCFEATATNSLKMELCFHGNSPKPTSADSIWYQFISTTNEAPFRVYLPDDAYLCTIELRDANHNPVPKTRAGRKYGSRFNEQVNSPRQIIAYEERSRASGVSPNGSGKFQIPVCDDLFRIKKPGDYTLRLQIQVVKEVVKDRKFLRLELVTFPPLEIKVEKR